MYPSEKVGVNMQKRNEKEQKNNGTQKADHVMRVCTVQHSSFETVWCLKKWKTFNTRSEKL